MSRAKAQDMRNLSLDELRHKKDGWEKELHDLRHKKVTGQLDKPHFFKQVRRQIAQANTIEQEKKNESDSKRAK